MKKKQKGYTIPKRDAAFIKSVVSETLNGQTKAATNAGRIKRRFKSRKAARRAMLACYPKGKVNGKARGYYGQVHNACNYLLRLAYKGKAKSKSSRTSNVDGQAARIVSGHSKGYCRRLITVMQALLRK